MSIASDANLGSTSRRLRLRARRDLTIRRQTHLGQECWIVKDPLGLNYFNFRDEEYFLLQALDGSISLDDLQVLFEARFAPRQISPEDLWQLVVSLHQSGLVVSTLPGQGEQLHRQRDTRRRKELLGKFQNVLAVQFRGIDPDRLLSAMYPWVRRMFTRAALLVYALLAVSALLLVVVQFDTFQARLPGFHQFFNFENAMLMAVVLAITKVIHEFGHGLTCKHFGGECHEMGLLILVLTPCLYCDVSDSWLLPNKWHRALIGAAGMIIEVVIASICTFIWWFSEPGLLNNVCLSTMFICSVTTLLFNSNPLLRFDGYYILSDLMEVPNLRQKADSLLKRKASHLCLGLEPPEDPFLPQRRQWLFAAYSIAAWCYRWVVVISILWFLSEVFEPYGLKVLGQLLVGMALFGMVVMPLWRLFKFLTTPGRWEQVKTRNLAITGMVALLFIGFIGLVPLPHQVFCPLEIQPYEGASVYVDVAGRLEEVEVKPGQQVSQGVTLARLSSVEVQMAVARLEHEEVLQAAQLESLQRQQFNQPEASAQVPQVKESLEATRRQLQRRREDLEHLNLTATRDGVIFPPPTRSPTPPEAGSLPGWSGTPLDTANRLCHLEEGELFCVIGDPSEMEAVLIIDVRDVDLVREGDEVEIQLDQSAGSTLRGKINRIAHEQMQYAPEHLSNKTGGLIPTETDETGRERPQSTVYQAQVRLSNPNQTLRPNLRGTAKIHTRPKTLGQRLWRYLSHTFRFRG